MEPILVHARNPSAYTGAGNNTYLLLGRSPTLIDAGPGGTGHLEELQRRLSDAGPLARVLVTHAHVDHARGAQAISSQWPDVILAKMPWPDRDADYGVRWSPLRDGEEVPAGDGSLRVVHTPGHAPDHACFFDPSDGTAFTGDLLVTGGTVVVPASSGGSLKDYLTSLHRIIDLDPRRALPAHGPIIDRPANLARHYLEHRARREDQVLEALRRGLATPAEIVPVIYEALEPALFGAACESVLAHLLKLEAEGRVSRDGSRWSIG